MKGDAKKDRIKLMKLQEMQEKRKKALLQLQMDIDVFFDDDKIKEFEAMGNTRFFNELEIIRQDPKNLDRQLVIKKAKKMAKRRAA